MTKPINDILKRALKVAFDLSTIPNYTPRKFINSLFEHLVKNHFVVYEEDCVMYVGYNVIEDVAKIVVIDTTLKIEPLQEQGFFDILIELFKFIGIIAKISLIEKKTEDVSTEDYSEDDSSEEMWL